MIMKLKRILLLALLSMASHISLNAQDTIDTAYYRYGNNFYNGNPWCLWDTLTGSYVFDPETGDPISACPNGYGFTFMMQVDFDQSYHHYLNNGKYLYYRMAGTETKRTIYGIAISLDSVSNFMEGDSITIILCEPASDHSHFIHIDSIILRGGEIGKRRWCEIPIQKDSQRGEPWTSIQDNCIDTVLYRSIMEFYFDEPHEISEPHVFWKARYDRSYGSEYYITYVECQFDVQYYFHENCSAWFGDPGWDDFFPILTPLPEWEVPGLEQLIPDREYNPAVHQQDPDDPEDPENPEDPSDTEAIKDFYGKLSISVYPNPTTGLANISSPEAIKELVVTDLAGRVLLRQTPHQSSATLDTSPLSSGLYLLKVNTDSGSSTTKLTVR